MVTAQTLRNQARQGATWRGHLLTTFTALSDHLWRAQCMLAGCTGYIDVNTRPAPNEIDIGGSACGLDCPTSAE